MSEKRVVHILANMWSPTTVTKKKQVPFRANFSVVGEGGGCPHLRYTGVTLKTHGQKEDGAASKMVR
jgi:hypothetical protein